MGIILYNKMLRDDAPLHLYVAAYVSLGEVLYADNCRGVLR